MKIYKTKYDGYYIVVNEKNKVFVYEGLALMPPRFKKMIPEINVTELNCTHREAIQYGYV